MAREALGDDHDPEDPLNDLVRLLLIVAPPTISLENHPGGLVGVAYDPLGMGHNANGVRVLPSVFDERAADAVRRVPRSVLGRAGERMLEPGDEARELFTLAVLSKEAREYEHEEGSGEYVFPCVQVVEIPDQVGDPERRLDEAVSAEPEMGDGWFTETDQGLTRVSDAAAEIVQAVEDGANRLLPTFVLEQGRVQVDVVSPANWTAGQPRVAIGFNLGEGSHAEFSMLGAGTRRWVAACVAEAHRRWYGPPAGRPALFVVDEPELHLHPTAQHDIGVWLTERAAEGHRVLVATHSPAILNRVGPDADILGVARNQSLSTLVPIGGDLLDSLSEFADDFGVEASVWLQLTRAVLVVEGEHDKKILEAFFGVELDRSLVRILAIRGTGNALALIDSDFLGAAGIPLRVMFDAVRPGAVTGEIPPQDFSPEETKLGKVLEHLGYQRLTGHDVAPVPYSDPDVICALPASAVRRAFPDADFPGWDTIIEEWSHDSSRGFKKFAISMTDLNGVTPDGFVNKVLAARDPSDEPAPTLTAAVASLLQTIR